MMRFVGKKHFLYPDFLELEEEILVAIPSEEKKSFWSMNSKNRPTVSINLSSYCRDDCFATDGYSLNMVITTSLKGNVV